MDSKHLSFALFAEKPKTKVWLVHSKNDGFQLGKVFWQASWRKYIFCPTIESETVWSVDCLEDLKLFIQEKMKEHKEKRLIIDG